MYKNSQHTMVLSSLAVAYHYLAFCSAECRSLHTMLCHTFSTLCVVLDFFFLVIVVPNNSLLSFFL